MRLTHRAGYILNLFLALLLASVAAASEKQAAATKTSDKKQKPKFVRVLRDKSKSPVALQTNVVRYTRTEEDGSELVVELVGAIHIGERSYYEALNKRFRGYDVVLYELVAPEGTRIPKGGRGRSTHPVSMLQGGLKSLLGLEFQLECVDYTRPNFVHADMTPDEFSKSMKDRGESFTQMFFRMMGQSIATQSNQASRGGDAALLVAMLTRDHRKIRRLMAEQLDGMEGQLAALNGDSGSTIITERNRRAFDVLKEQIAKGKRRIAVFYGAGHLPDMEERLLKDFRMKRKDEIWLTAWSLADPKKDKKPRKRAKPALR